MSEEAVRMPWKETETNFSAIEVDVTVFPNNRCREFYGDEFVGDKMLCAGHEEGGVDACQVGFFLNEEPNAELTRCIAVTISRRK